MRSIIYEGRGLVGHTRAERVAVSSAGIERVDDFASGEFNLPLSSSLHVVGVVRYLTVKLTQLENASSKHVQCAKPSSVGHEAPCASLQNAALRQDQCFWMARVAYEIALQAFELRVSDDSSAGMQLGRLEPDALILHRFDLATPCESFQGILELLQMFLNLATLACCFKRSITYLSIL
jgi:hypothetical protein